MLGILMTKLGCEDEMPPNLSEPRSHRGSGASRGDHGAARGPGEGLEDTRDAMEVESMGDEDEGDPGELALEKTFSNESLEILRESAAGFHKKPSMQSITVPRLVVSKAPDLPGSCT